MSHLLYKLSVYIHILSAMFWLGGMLFTVFVLVPISRNSFISENRGVFFAIMGKRFSSISWLLFVILTITGYIQLLKRGFGYQSLVSSEFWSTHFGGTLALKLIFFTIMIIISFLHDFWLGPKASILMSTQPELKQTKLYQKSTRYIGRLNLLLGMIILFYAISLVRG